MGVQVSKRMQARWLLLAVCFASCAASTLEELHLGTKLTRRALYRQSVHLRLSVRPSDMAPGSALCIHATPVHDGADVDLYVNFGKEAAFPTPQAVPQYRSATAGPEAVCIPRPSANQHRALLVLITVYGYGARLPAGNDFEITSWFGGRDDELVTRQLGVSLEEPADTQNQYPSGSARQSASDGDQSEDLSYFEEKTVQEDEGTLLWLGKGL